MVRRTTLAAGAAGATLAALGAWNLYQRHTTETARYTVVARVGDAELRRYPPAALAETEAPDRREAFGRLFRYIDGANDGGEELSMTAPVEVGERGASLSMTAPVEVAERDDGVRMAFYLPEGYDVDSAPRPTDERVSLVSLPERTLAVRRFSWRATESRIAREAEKLAGTLDDAGVPVAGEPFFLGYDAPWTLPFLRRNEVAVEVESRG
jgi:hypothetical protein